MENIIERDSSEMYSLYRIVPGSALEGYIKDDMHGKLEFYSLRIILEHIKDYLITNELYDKSNPSIVLPDSKLQQLKTAG